MSNSLVNNIIQLLQTTSLFSSTQRDCHWVLTQQHLATIPSHTFPINSKWGIRLKAHFIFHVAPEHAAAESFSPISKFCAQLLIVKVFRNDELCQWFGWSPELVAFRLPSSLSYSIPDGRLNCCSCQLCWFSQGSLTQANILFSNLNWF